MENASHRSQDQQLRGAACGLLAALLFGLSSPLAKLLLGDTGPLLLAGLLYLGAGLGLSAFGLLRRASRAPRSEEGSARPREAPLRRADLLLLAGVVLSGGILGPFLMLVGLTRLSAMVGSLLLNLEAVFTILLALVLFGEHLGRSGAAAAACIIGGALVLSYQPGELRADGWGVAAVAAACLSWGIDNNLTQRLSLRDPLAVVRIKTLSAGACNLGLALALGQRLPGGRVLLLSLLLGLLSYGISVLLDVYALRLLGAAREAAFFATAPFVGALAAVPLLHERPGLHALGGMAVMATGAVLLLRERHSHEHAHEETEHDHIHVHDEHHQHAHEGPVTEPHAHPHRHAPLVHEHPHVPDLHHRHKHE